MTIFRFQLSAAESVLMQLITGTTSFSHFRLLKVCELHHFGID